MDANNKSFALTARCLGHPRKLVTPLTIVNLDAAGEVVAAKVNAMWDTGAETCLVSRALAYKLGYEFDRIIPAQGLTGSAEVPIGYASITLVSSETIIRVMTAIVEEISPSGDYSFIIGLDLISRGSLALTFSGIGTTLSFVAPACQLIDFAELADIPDYLKSYFPLCKDREKIELLHGEKALALLSDLH